MMYYGGWGGWGWVAMGVMMLLFWGGLAAAVIVLLVNGTRTGWGGRGHYPSPYDDPELILHQRFARGEIDEAEYKARLEALRRKP